MGQLPNTPFKVNVVGVTNREGYPDNLRAIQDVTGHECLLQAEPDNPYDANAVAVTVDGSLCGYLPRTVAKKVTETMAAGAYFAILSWKIKMHNPASQLPGMELTLKRG